MNKNYIDSYSVDYRYNKEDAKIDNSESANKKTVTAVTPLYIKRRDIFDEILIPEETKQESEYEFQFDVSEKAEEELQNIINNYKKGKTFYRIIMGGLLLAAMLASVILISNSVVIDSKALRPQAKEASVNVNEYSDLLKPVVMQDPKKFENIDKADPEMVMTSGLWETILKNSNRYTNFDKEGKTVIPEDDVEKGCKTLFGPDCKITGKNPQNYSFFEFNEQEKAFHVLPISNHNTYFPYISDCNKYGEMLEFKVGYIFVTDEWLTNSALKKEPTPDKYMKYIFKTDPSTEHKYIYAIDDWID